MLKRVMASTAITAAALLVSASANADSITFSPLAASSIPTLSGALLITLSVAMGLVALFMLKKRIPSGFPMAIALLVAGTVLSGTAGISIISTADALNPPTPVSNRNGGTFPLNLGLNEFENVSGVPLRVVRVTETGNTCIVPDMPPIQPESLQIQGSGDGTVISAKDQPVPPCSPGSVLANGGMCAVFCSSNNL